MVRLPGTGLWLIQLNKNNVTVFEMSHRSNHFADSPFAARVSGRESLRYRLRLGLPSSSTRTWAPAPAASGTLSIMWTSGPSWKSDLGAHTIRFDWYFSCCVRDEKAHFSPPKPTSLQCLQSSRSQVGGSNPDSSVEEKFQKTLNPWTGRSQLPLETFKFELRPVWCAAGTERHSPPPSPSWLERY